MRAVHAVAVALAVNIVVSAQQIAPVHVLKISSGSTGTETNGVFTLTDERSVFNLHGPRGHRVLPMGTRPWSTQACRAVAQR